MSPLSSRLHRAGKLMMGLPALTALLMLAPVQPAQAVWVAGYTAEVNNRFTIWNSDLTPNTSASFALAGLDMTGLFWDASGRTYAALSNQTFIGSHDALSPGSTISYWDGTTIGTATIASIALLSAPASSPSDAELCLYTLSSSLPGVNPLPILTGGSTSDYEGMQIAMFGHSGTVVIETLDLVGRITYSPLILSEANGSIQNGPNADIVGAALEYPGLYESGDSNSAVLGFWNGQWGILGSAWAVTSDPRFSLFNFMPSYVDELPNGVNYSVIVVPEPGRALLLMLGAIGMVCRRRRR
ncbi:PEP-CTERM sorting domain-containing protein [Roseimicrobium sp. ORNL1]|uniref:PEP-CTERM sorting domain-containing protein n=1 Tax=Roseimicrobium sp. ORNL1 TaxID=2711231 RepID=UPI0013E0F3C8|nr:PEP-CTERM sorting domain-containing protein [Roseimicrobium sp. ORNL1]QIF03286.1 PEP-CTERM sorting domain-containing protein [Roseimicrobium sp. ORNL1]